jgi:DNA-binding beta-propeller fold protein YncE
LGTPGGFVFSSSTQNRVYRIQDDGKVRVVAGTGASDFGGDGGSAVAAPLNSPAGVAVDAAGNVFIADRGNTVNGHEYFGELLREEVGKTKAGGSLELTVRTADRCLTTN